MENDQGRVPHPEYRLLLSLLQDLERSLSGRTQSLVSFTVVDQAQDLGRHDEHSDDGGAPKSDTKVSVWRKDRNIVYVCIREEDRLREGFCMCLQIKKGIEK